MKKGLVFTAVVCAISMGLVSCKKQAPAPTLESISVTAPTKTVYTVGDTFDPTGMVVTANYSDQSTKTIEEGYTYTTPDMSTAGQKDVVVTYQEKTASFTITVNAPVVPEVVSIRVTPPTKVEYAPNDQFDPTGMVVTAIFDDEHEETVAEGYSVTAPDMTKAGKQTVTVTYKGKTDSFEIRIFQVTITNKETLQSLWRVGTEQSVSVKIPGVTVADAVKAGDLVISVSDDEILSVNGLKVNALKDGAATITATYKGKYSDSVEVTIDKALTYRIVTEFDSEHDYLLGLIPSSGKIGFASIDMDGYYIASHIDASEAGKVRITEEANATTDYKYVIRITATVEGEEVTKTVASYKGGGHINIGFVEDKTAEYAFETALFKFNDDYSFSTMIDGEEFWMGTYTTYYTFSYRDAKTIEYKARLYEEGEPVPATAVELNKSELALEVPGSEKLQATVTPATSTDFVEWSSSDESVAVVNSQGLVTAVEHGEAVITAKAGEVSATCTVTVTGDKIDFGTEENPIDVNTAINVLNRFGGNVITTQKMWVKGIVSESAAENATYKNRVVWLQNNDGSEKKAFELYNAVIDTTVIKDLPATANALRGKEVVAEGWGKLYTNASGSVVTPELTPINNADNPVVRTMAEPTFPAATGIALNKTALELAPNGAETLEVSVEPAIIVPNVVWDSSDKNVATVDSNGKVTGVAVGTATITVTFGELSATCAVTVAGSAINYGTEENPLTPDQARSLLDDHFATGYTAEQIWVKGIATSVSSKTVTSGTAYTVWLANKAGTVEQCFEIYSANADSSVDVTKLVAGAEVTAHGFATIYTSGDNKTYELAGGSATGNVYPLITKVDLEVKPLEGLDVSDQALNMGEDKQLDVKPLPSTASLEGITYVSADPAVVTISETGLMHPVAVGSTTITITVGAISKQITVTVATSLNYGTRDNPLTIEEAKAIIDTVEPNTMTSQKLWVKGFVTELESYNSQYQNRNIWLQSDDGTVAKDFEIYRAKAHSELTVEFTDDSLLGMDIVVEGLGKKYVSTSDPSKPAVYELSTDSSNANNPYVYDALAPALQSITLSEPALNLAPAGTATLVASAAPAKASLEGLVWESSDPTVASVDANGVVTGVAAGSASITAKVGEIVSAACVVTVQAAAKPATDCTISATELALEVGASSTLTSTVTPTDTTDVAAWSSSDETVATVVDGVVNAVAAGTATITVKYNNSVSKTCVVTVSVEHGKDASSPLTPDEAKGKDTGSSWYVGGVIALINTAYSSQYNNISVSLLCEDGSLFQLFRLGCTEQEAEKLVVGNSVVVHGEIGEYSNAKQLAAGGVIDQIVEETKVTIMTIGGGASVTVGSDLLLTANAFPTSVTPSITWESSNKDVATVDATGLVTGVAAGEATITATDVGGVSASINITVMAAGEKSSKVVISEQGYTNQQAIASITIGDVTVTLDKGTNSNAPKYYTSGTAIRAYGGNTLAFSASGDYKISKIVITFGTSDGSNEITASVGTFDTDTWTGESASVTLTIGGTSGNRRIAAIEVFYA